MGLLISPPLARRLGIEALKQPRLSSLLFSVHHHLTLSHNLFPRKHSTTCIAECDFNDFDDNADAKARDKDAALRSALSRLSSDFGRESMLSLQRFFRSRRAPVISTGSLNLDIALGTGGLPKGRIVEIYGQEASGKTTLALHIVKEAQKLGGYCAYLDVENAMDPSLAESIGVNTENLLISYPNSAENVLNVVDTLTKSGSLDVIVVDSVAALVPQCELDGVIGDEYPYPNAQSRIMTQALRKIQSSLCNSRTLLVFLNQVRWSPNSRQGGPLGDVTAGGNALRFYAAVRLRIKRTQLIKAEDEITGLGISVLVMKNKLAPAMKKADLQIQFGRGLRCESEVLQLACKHGIIAKQGSNYLIGRKVFSSQQAVERCLAENDKLLDKIVEILRNRLFERESLVK